MTKDEKLKQLEAWQETMELCNGAMSNLDALVGAGDGPLYQNIWATQGDYTRNVGLLIGDDNEWLEWYWLENDFGRKGLGASVGPDMPTNPIQSLPELLDLIDA